MVPTFGITTAAAKRRYNARETSKDVDEIRMTMMCKLIWGSEMNKRFRGSWEPVGQIVWPFINPREASRIRLEASCLILTTHVSQDIVIIFNYVSGEPGFCVMNSIGVIPQWDVFWQTTRRLVDRI